MKFLQQTEIDGYVSASYFYNFNRPGTHENAGRGFDARADEFMANKLVVRVGHPVDYSAFDWLAGYSAKLIFGQDAEFTQAAGLDLGTQGDLFEANVTVNVPVGSGLKVTLGKFGTTMGYESTFTEENFNWSGGNQWVFAEPFTHTGVLLAYQATSELELKVTLNNGWDDVADNNHAKSVMGTATYTVNDKTQHGPDGLRWSRTGCQQLELAHGCRLLDRQQIHTEDWRVLPSSIMAPRMALTPTVTEPNGLASAVGWFTRSTINGTWRREPTTLKTAMARAHQAHRRWLHFPVNTGQELCSVTLTVNFKPVDGLKLAPEFRWDHSSLDTAFDGRDTQVTVGMGAVYSY